MNCLKRTARTLILTRPLRTLILTGCCSWLVVSGFRRAHRSDPENSSRVELKVSSDLTRFSLHHAFAKRSTNVIKRLSTDRVSCLGILTSFLRRVAHFRLCSLLASLRQFAT